MRNFWDWYARWYDRLEGRRSNRDIAIIKELGRFAKSDMVLDLGGGTGRVAEKIKDLVDEIIVADTSFGMLKEAAKKGLKTFSFAVLPLSFPEETFDKILLIKTLHHLDFPEDYLREIYRLLKRGGALIIEDPDYDKFLVRISITLEKIYDRNVRGYTRNAIRRLLETAGFKNVSLQKNFKMTQWRLGYFVKAIK